MSYPPPPQPGPYAYGPPPRKRNKLPFVLAGIGVALVLCLGGAMLIGTSGDKAKDDFADGYAQGLAAAQASASAPAATEPATTAPTTVVAPATTEATTKATVAPARTTVAATTVKVPSGVGLDYQSAQDLWRGAGLIVAPAKDATGAHRLPVIDANWVVLAQDLKAGSRVPEGTLITATVKKYTDD
ncbi:PASTA domain-containing protein [Actinoplanes sp. HUAS TT8]|uniref:PASTA domain-containing protein n=1 Tax=Actinoplanes sp. HUAS TT8 TaxID=3447453 RepID=UPI003F5212F0